MDIKKLNEELEKFLQEDSWVKQYEREYESEDQNALVKVSFNYNYACFVMVETSNFTLVWDQYDNAIYYGINQNDDESIPLPDTDELAPSREDLESTIKQINIPEDFPINLFYDEVEKVVNDIKNNYRNYWSDYHKKYDNKGEV